MKNSYYITSAREICSIGKELRKGSYKKKKSPSNLLILYINHSIFLCSDVWKCTISPVVAK